MAYRRSCRSSRAASREVTGPSRRRTFDSRDRDRSGERPLRRSRSPSYVVLRAREHYDYRDRSRSRSFRKSERLPSRWSPVRSISPSPRASFRYESLERPPKDLEVPPKRKRRVRRRGVSMSESPRRQDPDRWSPRRPLDGKVLEKALKVQSENAPRDESRNGLRRSRSSSRTDAGPPGNWAPRRSQDHYRARRRSSQEYLQMAQQAAMMRFMPHPGYMALMHQQMGMMSPQMMGMAPTAPRAKKSATGRSSSSDSYSSSSPGQQRLLPGGTMFPVPPPLPAGPDVEGFLRDQAVDAEVAERLKALPPHVQNEVMRRGPLDSRSPTSMLLSRMKQALEADRNGELHRGAVAPDAGMRPMKQTTKNAIEALISDFGLSPECSWMLRSLPPDKQKLAAKIDPTGQADASGYVAAELQKIV